MGLRREADGAFMRGMALRSSERWCDIVIYNKRYIFGLPPVPGGASQVAQLVKKLPATHEMVFDPWVGKSPWRREWQPTPVFLPGEFHGQRSLVGYSPGVAKSQTQLSDYHLSSFHANPGYQLNGMVK